MRHVERLCRLDALLGAHSDLWRTQPFKVARPGWCHAFPALTDAALALSDDAATRLASDNAMLVDWLSRFVPALQGLADLIALPESTAVPLGELPSHFRRDVPGRKRMQITAFAGAIGAPQAPVLEWCAGKGHLGRLVAHCWKAPVTSLEHDPALCAGGTQLAAREGAAQEFIVADALSPAGRDHLAGRHALALHACGDLHHALLDGAVDQRVPALDLVPCCYHKTRQTAYRSRTGAALVPSRDDLRLAVLETVTAPAAESRRVERATAWKLAFVALRGELSRDSGYRSFKPVPPAWMRAGFENFCRRLADREGIVVPARIDWPALERRGRERAAGVRRLSLPRLAFRRALEIWLAMDYACALEAAGYSVRVAQFCAREITPRNLLISARR